MTKMCMNFVLSNVLVPTVAIISNELARWHARESSEKRSLN